MVSPPLVSRKITKSLSRLESGLKRKLLAFYNANIAGSISPIESLRRKYDTTVRNIIRKAVQDSYLQGTDIVGQQIAEKQPDFELFISGTDVNNIQQFTDNMTNQFWNTASKLLTRETELKQINGEVTPKPDLNKEVAMIGLSSLIAFGAFNNAIKSKLPITTAPPPSQELQLDIGFQIIELKGRVRFTTQHDAKVDPEICAPLDGQEWDANDPDIVVPPEDTHRFCRCHLVPIVE